MSKFHIDKPYRDQKIFDVMFGPNKLAEGDEYLRTVKFEAIDFLNEIAGKIDVSKEDILAASAWCRELGYKTNTEYEGWIDGEETQKEE